jgi:hypothetical protein
MVPDDNFRATAYDTFGWNAEPNASFLYAMHKQNAAAPDKGGFREPQSY